MWASSLLCEFGTHSDGAIEGGQPRLFMRYPIEGLFIRHGGMIMEQWATLATFLYHLFLSSLDFQSPPV